MLGIPGVLTWSNKERRPPSRRGATISGGRADPGAGTEYLRQDGAARRRARPA